MYLYTTSLTATTSPPLSNRASKLPFLNSPTDHPAVRIHVQPVAGARPLAQGSVFMLTASHRFEMLVTSLRKKLKLQPHESLFCYIGNVFSPALDETVENLWRVS